MESEMDELKKVTEVFLPVKVYFNPTGAHTCAANFPKGEVCSYLRVRKFGTEEFCAAVEQTLFRYSEMGYLKPDKDCPIAAELERLKQVKSAESVE